MWGYDWWHKKNKLISEYKNKYLFCSEDLNLVAKIDGTKFSLTKVETVGFPDSSIYKQIYLDVMKDDINTDYQKIILRSMVFIPGLDVYRAPIIKYCNLL